MRKLTRLDLDTELTARATAEKNGWQSFDASIGRYGTDYRARAIAARNGLGAK